MKSKILSVTPFKISLFIIVSLIVLYLFNVPFFYYMELKSLDLRFKARGVMAPGNETVIAAIDEKSLSELGRWPWTRSTIAKLVDRLHRYGARAVGFDVVFAEPDENVAKRTIDGFASELKRAGIESPDMNRFLTEKRKESDTDRILAKSFKDAGNVTMGYFFYTSRKDVEHLSDAELKDGIARISDSKYRIVKFRGTPIESPVIQAYAVAPNIKVLSDAGENAGYFNAFPDIDGTNRWSPLVIQLGEDYYPSLALSVLEQYLDWPTLSLVIAEYGVEGISINDLFIPTDEAGRILINYLGPIKTFPHYSVTDIINERLSPEHFKDKIVLVGATATGIYDLRVTPFSTAYPGIGIHAT
ncbi:MAG: CHASE2 domain-containing protein, partial [Chitinivibrionales bacterium]|nr:CHASE2 domain-containing protein [Chitinivibrionales bacterium]